MSQAGRSAALSAPPPAASRPEGELKRFACRRCGEPIGVYEPLVAAIEERPRLTSRAAEPDLRCDAGTYFHRDCYEQGASDIQASLQRSAWRRARAAGRAL